MAGDPLALIDIRQLDANTIAGIRGGRLLALNPEHPEKPRVIAPASTWFPDSQLTGGWTVTESLDQPACPGIGGTTAGTIRYRLERRSLASGTVISAARALPCRMRPIADLRSGLVVSVFQDRVIGKGHGGVVPADIQLVSPATFQPVRTVLTEAVVLQAAGNTVIAAKDDCRSGNCAVAVGMDNTDRAVLKSPADGGSFAGSGLLDPTGRYYAAAWISNGSTTLLVCDLREGTYHVLGPYFALTPGAPSSLPDDMPSVWSGSRLLIVDPSKGTLTAYDAKAGATSTRADLTTTGTLQVWGAGR